MYDVNSMFQIIRTNKETRGKEGLPILLPVTPCLSVEEEPMQYVFQQRPRKDPCHNKQCKPRSGVSHASGYGDEPAHHRDPNYGDHPPSGSGQELPIRPHFC